MRGAWVGGTVIEDSGGAPLGQKIVDAVPKPVVDLIAQLIAVDSMDESVIKSDGAKTDFQGNPTECALLALARDMGHDYAQIRSSTEGRSEATLSRGQPFMFSSARKMMSWAVPLKGGGYRLFSKGASEIVISRCDLYLTDDKAKKKEAISVAPLGDDKRAEIKAQAREMRARCARPLGETSRRLSMWRSRVFLAGD